MHFFAYVPQSITYRFVKPFRLNTANKPAKMDMRMHFHNVHHTLESYSYSFGKDVK